MPDHESSTRWQRVKEIVDRALDLDAEARPAYLESECADDVPLGREVLSLIEAAVRDWSLMDMEGAASSEFAEPPEASRVGHRIGPYELLSELGRGGMGQVFLARRADDEFQKKVAIKVVPPGPARQLALERFRSERQISAGLEHPNIARLLDGGTSEGEPYFVMEYVEGESLLSNADRRRLSTNQRLELFQEICGAVHYAHQHLVVHRDIKPSNILVTDEGVPKLLDFGIAKLLDPAGLSAAAASTAAAASGETGTMFRILTPDYASPEQVRGQRISTASDVYSLGVVLYELLSGQKPYRIVTGDPAELVRLVCERDPEKPSARSPGLRLSADLDAIVLKALRKEPERRYTSAQALSEDLDRYLNGLPVLARRGTASYRFGKFMRRHRVTAAAAALVLLAMAGGMWSTLREARRARLAEARAERRFNDVRRLANSFLFEFHDAIRDLPGSTLARALLVRRALGYLDGLARESAGDPSLRRELSEAYQRVGDVQGNSYMANLGDVPGALESYRKAIALLEPSVRAGSAGDAEKSTLASAYLTGGGIRLIAGDVKTAVAMAEKGLPLRQELARRNPSDVTRQMELAQAYQFYAFDLSVAGRDREARESLEKQAAILRERLTHDPKNRQVRRGLGQNLYLMGQARRAIGDTEGALRDYGESVLLREGLREEDPLSIQLERDLAWARNSIGEIAVERRDFPRALEQFALALKLFESMAAADPNNVDGRLGIAMTRQNFGGVAASSGHPDGALRDFEAARILYEPLVGADPTNAWTAGLLSELYLAIGEAEEKLDGGLARACGAYRQSSEAFRRLRAADRLQPMRVESSGRAERMAARCRGTRERSTID